MRKTIKRFIVDFVGNYIFFVPLVILVNGQSWGWSWDVIRPHLLTSLPFAALSGRAFLLFLGKVWYPITKETF